MEGFEQRNTEVEIHIAREDSYISMQNFHTLVRFEVIEINDSLYADSMENHLINHGTFTLLLWCGAYHKFQKETSRKSGHFQYSFLMRKLSWLTTGTTE